MGDNIAAGPARLHRLTATAIVKNEAPYLAEWIEYHGLLGVEHFYIFDNHSSDDLVAELDPYIVQGRVTLLVWRDYPGQVSAYNFALRTFGRDSDWMMFIDADEFVHIPAGGSLPAFLDDLGEVDQLLISWMHFGGSGHMVRPEGLVIENFVHRTAEPSLETKCVVRPDAAIWAEVHHCITRNGRTVNGDGIPVPERWCLSEPAAERIRINHYRVKSREEFDRKRARGQADGLVGRFKNVYELHRCETLDRTAAVHADAVRHGLEATHARPRRWHVSAPFSPYSELTPSRDWVVQSQRDFTDLQRSLAAKGIAARIEVGVESIVLRADAAWEPAIRHLTRDAFAGLDSGMSAWSVAPWQPMTAGWHEGLALGAGAPRLGRPSLHLLCATNLSGTLIVRTDGHDANGKAIGHEVLLGLERGITVAALIVSSRTICVETIRLSGLETLEMAEASVAAFL